MFLRLSIEDIAKSWAAACFFAAAWCLARFHIGIAADATTVGQWVERNSSGLVGAIDRKWAASWPSTQGEV